MLQSDSDLNPFDLPKVVSVSDKPMAMLGPVRTANRLLAMGRADHPVAVFVSSHIIDAIVVDCADMVCRPIDSCWNKTIEGFHCRSPRNQDFAILTLNSCFDIIVYTWPAHYLYKLNLPFKSRAELIIAFSIGVVYVSHCVPSIYLANELSSNLGLSFARLSLLVAMYSSEEWMRYGPPGVLIIIVESHVGITCASLPYLRYLFEFVSTNYLSRSAYGATKDPTKAKHSDPNNVSHPFVELGGRGIERKTDIEISTFKEEGSEEDLRTEVHGGRNRAMEEQMRRDESAWSAEEMLLDDRHTAIAR